MLHYLGLASGRLKYGTALAMWRPSATDALACEEANQGAEP